MDRVLQQALGNDYLTDEESLAAYSYDASRREEKPAAVCRPNIAEQVRRILVHANEKRLAVVPRGSGTNIRAATVKEDCLIVDMRRFGIVDNLDHARNTVDVSAGVTIRQLNEALAKHGYYFPLVPENGEATLGGLASQNHVTEESQLFGDYHDVVEQIECFDALGREHTLRDKELLKVIGREGTTGIILRLRLKVWPLNHKLTAEVIAVSTVEEALAAGERLAKKQGLLLLEYLGANAAKRCGFDEQSYVIAAFANDTGSYKDRVYVEQLLARRKKLEQRLWQDGYLLLEEATLTSHEQTAAFVALCAKEQVPCYSHLGLGLWMTACKDAEQAERIRNGILAAGGIPGGKHGYGRTKKSYVPVSLRSEIIKLKEEWDYRGIMNQGVLQ